MRIAVVNWSRRRVGGVETYLKGIIPEMHSLGHQLAFWSEVDIPSNREQITLPDGVPAWCVSEVGEAHAVAALKNWRPDVLYVHKVAEPRIEAQLLKIAAGAFFAHDYYGTCISGLKTFKRPQVRPCNRRMGWQCLAHYYPHRCGGLSPVTMLKMYRLQAKRLELLRNYKAIITHSEHLRTEYIQHGLNPEFVYNLSYYSHQVCKRPEYLEPAEVPKSLRDQAASLTEFEEIKVLPRDNSCHQLLFLGRMDRLKGGSVFLDALPQVKESLGRPVRVVFAGDGTERVSWEHQARRVQSRHDGLTIDFTGWVEGAELEALWAESDLLVVPSLWPEPFGLVGVEAGLHGVPAAAFAVGGIPTWLTDGVNGYLAPGDPPTSGGLARAIIKCLSDRAVHDCLRRGAVDKARQFNLEEHLSAVMSILEKVVAAN